MIRASIILISAAGATAAEVVTYEDHVLPVFQQACLNCHNPDKTKGGLDLSSYTGAMKGGSGGKIAEPGDTGSTLIAVVKHSAEPKMPPEGDKLSNEQIGILVKWIEGGLLETKSSTAKKPTKPKFSAPVGSDPAARPEGPPPMPAHLLLEPPVVTGSASAVHAIAASPWAPLVAITGQKQVLLHRTDTLELAGILPFPEGDPVSLSFTPDARYLIVGGGVPGKSGVTVTFDVTNGSRLLATGKEFDSILAADVRPSFDIVCTGGPSKLLKFWNTETGEAIHSIKKHTDWITALDLSPDGVLLASGDRNGGVWVWESETGNEFHTLRAHQAAITAAAFRSDSNILGTSSEDGTIRFWEMNGGSEVKKIDAHPGGVTAFAFARDGSSASTGRDMKVKLWKPDFTHARDLSQALPALPTSVAIDMEGKRVFVGDAIGQVHVFEANDGKPAGVIPSNPPLIETRLAEIDAKIATLGKSLQGALAELETHKGRLESGKNELSALEAALHQANETKKNAEAEAAKQADEARRKTASEAAAAFTAAESAVREKKQALAGLETAASVAETSLRAAEADMEPLRTSRNRWTAAAILAKALHAQARAEDRSRHLEEAQSEFSSVAIKLQAQANRLNEKRSEWIRLNECKTAPKLSKELLQEIEFTLSAIQISLSKEEEVYKELETKLEDASRRIDPEAEAYWQSRLEERSHREAYQQVAGTP